MKGTYVDMIDVCVLVALQVNFLFLWKMYAFGKSSCIRQTHRQLKSIRQYLEECIGPL